MSLLSNLTAAAVAAALITALGTSVLPPAGDGPAIDTSPSPSQMPVPSPMAYTWPGDLAPGTYSTDFAFDLPVAVTFTVGDGWQSRDVNLIKNDRVSLMVLAVDNLYRDACSGVLQDPPIGPTVDDLADGLAALPGLVATPPSDAMLGDLEGRYLEYTVSADAGCALGSVKIHHLAPMVCDAGCGGLGGRDVGVEIPVTGTSHRAWVLDIGGRARPLLIEAVTSPDATSADVQDLLAVVGSISIRRTVPATPPPMPASS